MRFDLGAQPGDRPVAPVRYGLLQQGRDTRNAVSLLTGAGPGHAAEIPAFWIDAVYGAIILVALVFGRVTGGATEEA